MDNKRYTVTLADGQKIDSLRLNGNNFISSVFVDAAIFEGNCSPVIINDGSTDAVHENMALIHVMQVGSEYWFALRDVSEQEMTAIQYAASVRYLNATVSDEDAVNCVDMFPVWSSNSKHYAVGDRVRYGKLLYKCLQAHISQPSWTPVAAVSLWVAISDPTVEWPEWVQPTGAHDAYAAGAKVSHNGLHWISDVDSNTWEPGVYGWTENAE